MVKKREIFFFSILTLFFTTFGFLYEFRLYAATTYFPFLNLNLGIIRTIYSIGLYKIFYCVGALLSVLLLGRVNKRHEFGLFGVVMFVVFAIYPLCTSYKVYYVITCISAFIKTPLEILPNLFVIEMFNDSNYLSLFIQTLHFFRSFDEVITRNLTINMFQKDIEKFNQTEFTQDKAFIKTLFYSRIWIPFFVLNLTMAILFTIFMRYKSKSKNDDIELTAQSDWTSIDKKVLTRSSSRRAQELADTPYEKHKKHLSHEYKILFILVTCMMLGTQLVVQENAKAYMFDFLSDSKGFDDDKILDTLTMDNYFILFGALTTGSKLLNIIISLFSKKTSMHIALLFWMMFIGNGLIFADYHSEANSIELFYTGMAFMVFGFSSILPLTIHLVNERITMTTNKMAILFFSNAVFFTVKEFLYNLFEINDRLVFFKHNFLFLSISIGTYILLLAVMEKIRLSRRHSIA